MKGEPNLPQLTLSSIWGYLKAYAEYNREKIRQYVPLRSAVDSILLQSPGGKVYRITVDDAGVVTTELILG